jgi:hypothetical protein
VKLARRSPAVRGSGDPAAAIVSVCTSAS